MPCHTPSHHKWSSFYTFTKHSSARHLGVCWKNIKNPRPEKNFVSSTWNSKLGMTWIIFFSMELKETKRIFLWIISWARLVESPCYFDSSRSFRFEKALVIIRYENGFVIFYIHNPFWKVYSFHLCKRKKITLEKNPAHAVKQKTTNCLWFFKKSLPLKISYVYACQIIFNVFFIWNMQPNLNNYFLFNLRRK